jgi:hypothetical protein
MLQQQLGMCMGARTDITWTGMSCGQVAAGLPQARLVVGTRQLQAPHQSRWGNTPAQALEAATLTIR